MAVPHRLPMPASAWVLGWGCLASQLLALGERGVRRSVDIGLVGSVVLGALVIGWFAAGVLRMRTGRRLVAWLILVLSVFGELVGLVDGGSGNDGWTVLQLVTSVVIIVALLSYQRSEFASAERRRVDGGRAPLGGVLWLAIAVGVLGGVVQVPRG